MLNEYSPKPELYEALLKVVEYSHKNAASPRVQCAFRKRMVMCVWNGNTPDGTPAMYVHLFDKKRIITYPYLLIEGKEGESYVSAWKDEIFMLHGHAIKRYIERTGTRRSRHDIVLDMLGVLSAVAVPHDSDTWYINYQEGMFLCTIIDGIFHIRTFITEKQAKQNQRLFAIKSENETTNLRKRILEHGQKK